MDMDMIDMGSCLSLLTLHYCSSSLMFAVLCVAVLAIKARKKRSKAKNRLKNEDKR